MKTNVIFILVFCFAIQLSCTTEPKVKAYDINPILNSRILSASTSAQAVKLQFCNEIPFQWDNMIVLSPYSTAEVIKEHHLSNSKSIQEMFPELTLDEGRTVLLFIKNNRIIRYGFVPRVPVDFNSLAPKKSSFKISREMACEKLYIKKDNNKFAVYY